MTLRIEPGRRHGPHDPRWRARPRLAAPQHAVEEPARPEPTERVAFSAKEPALAQWEGEGGAIR